MQPPPRTEVKVKAHIKSKRGEVVKAHFREVKVFAGGSVTPTDGWSSDTAPLTFTYTAGTQRASNAGFEILATSRAGIAKQGSWNATVGTDWSGQIECAHSTVSDPISNEQQTSSSSAATRYVVELQNGSGTARGYSDMSAFAQNLRGVVRNGTSSWVFDNSSSSNGVAQDEKAARVVVDLNTVKGTYRITVEHRPFAFGQAQSQTCDHTNGCFEQTLTFGVESCLPPGAGLYGEFVNPNELSGSIDAVQAGLGHLRNGRGKETWNITWHLSRQGTTR